MEPKVIVFRNLVKIWWAIVNKKPTDQVESLTPAEVRDLIKWFGLLVLGFAVLAVLLLT